jgi:hypothetical protein
MFEAARSKILRLYDCITSFATVLSKALQIGILYRMAVANPVAFHNMAQHYGLEGMDNIIARERLRPIIRHISYEIPRMRIDASNILLQQSAPAA